jgi:hypothetical protein
MTKRSYKLFAKDILNAIEKIEVFINDMDFDQFEDDKFLPVPVLASCTITVFAWGLASATIQKIKSVIATSSWKLTSITSMDSIIWSMGHSGRIIKIFYQNIMIQLTILNSGTGVSLFKIIWALSLKAFKR